MTVSRIFHRLNGTEPVTVKTQDIAGGQSNLGILLHTAVYGEGCTARISRVIEKRTTRKKDRFIARSLLQAQRDRLPTGGLPRIYRLGKSEEAFTIFQEFVPGVGSERLKQPEAIPAMSRAFRRLNRATLPGLEMRDKASAYDGRAAGILSGCELAGLSDDDLHRLKGLIARARAGSDTPPCHLPP